MATIAAGIMLPYRRTRIRHFPEDSSQTFIIGDLVALGTDSDEGNYIKVAAADPTTDRAIVGIAAGAATGVKGTMIPVYLATGDAEFVASVCGAALADETLDNDDISVEFGLLKDTAEPLGWRVDTSETTAKLVRVLQLLDAHGDTNGRVVVHFIAPERLYHD